MTDYRNNMVVDYSDEAKCLVIACPMWANDLIRDIPARRWSAGKKAWMVQITRQNIAYVRKIVALGGVQTTNRAAAAIADHDKAIESMDSAPTGFPTWYKFKTEPRRHQMAALNKGYHRKAFALFMDMQTGKTKTSIDFMAAHRMEGHIQAAVVFTKLSLRRNWEYQFGLHCPIPYSMHLPITGQMRVFEQWLARPHDFKIMVVGWESLSVGGMSKMCDMFVMAMHKIAVTGDETSYITNHKAERSKTAIRIAQQGEYKYALTGTPVPEGPMNLYSQFEFLDPNVIGIGDFYAFRNRYAIMGGFRPTEGPMRGKPVQIIGYQNMDELTTTIAPYTFQVMKTDAYDLPPKRYKRYEVQITKEQREVYQQVKREGTLNLEGSPELVLKNVLEVALRLHQVTGGYAVKPRTVRQMTRTKGEIEKIIYDPVELVAPADNPKIKALMEVVGETRHKKQGIIWAVYRPEIEAICKMMRAGGFRIGELHGGVPEDRRQPMVKAFQDGDLEWVVGNASTGGMGYTMMASEVNIFYNNTFKMIDRVQAEDRAYGDGQLKSGIWIDIVAEKTVDMAILKALDIKQDLATYVRDRIRDASKVLEGE